MLLASSSLLIGITVPAPVFFAGGGGGAFFGSFLCCLCPIYVRAALGALGESRGPSAFVVFTAMFGKWAVAMGSSRCVLNRNALNWRYRLFVAFGSLIPYRSTWHATLYLVILFLPRCL